MEVSSRSAGLPYITLTRWQRYLGVNLRLPALVAIVLGLASPLWAAPASVSDARTLAKGWLRG
jgi:hypothetical protein